MPKNHTKSTKQRKSTRKTVAQKGHKNERGSKPKRNAGARTTDRGATAAASFPYVMKGGKPAYVLVPVAEYEELVKARLAAGALAKMNDDDDTAWVNADDLALEFAAQRIAVARKAAGFTQKALGEKLNIPQSQISRIERKPDHTTVRTLKKIARALKVDVRSLL